MTSPADVAGLYSRRGLALAVCAAGAMVLAALTVAIAGIGLPGDAGQLAILYTVLLVILTLIGAVVVVTAGIVHLGTTNQRTRFRGLAIPAAVGAGMLVAVLGLLWVTNVATAGTGYLLSLPTTGIAVWSCRRLRTNRRPAWWLVGLGLVWGAVVAAGLAVVVESLLHEMLTANLLPGLATSIANATNAAVVEEITKGVGVFVLLVVFTRQLPGVLGGVVIGTAVGLGFQSAEAITYMHAHLGAVLYQYWYRQGAGLIVSHATYAALTGAGLGLALQQRGTARRICCGLSGVAVAMASHLVWDTATAQDWLWTPTNPTLYVCVALPLMVLAYKAPAFAALITLSIQANRRETRDVAAELRREADSGSDAVTTNELDTLSTPTRRRRARLRTLLSTGVGAYRRLHRLHRAQIDLALARLTRAEGNTAQPPDTEAKLRRRIYTIRHGHPPAVPITQPDLRPVPAQRTPAPAVATSGAMGARPLAAGWQTPQGAATTLARGWVGPYWLHARTGTTPLGPVYLAVAADGQQVQLRLLWTHLAHDLPFRHRLAQRLAATVRAPTTACVPIIAASIDAPTPWWATAIPAPSLAHTVSAHGPLPDPRGFAAQLAAALNTLHDANLIHGAVNGSTVTLTAHGPRYTDVGLASAQNPAAFLQTETAAGNLGFISPERPYTTPTTAGDIYSLGATLYLAATGHRPSTRPDLAAVPDPQLRPIILDCLATEPAQRPTAADLTSRLSGPSRIGPAGGTPTG